MKLVRTILIFLLAVSAVKADPDVSAHFAQLVRKIDGAPYRYTARIVYNPIYSEGSSSSEALYADAMFDLRISGLAWGKSLEALLGVLARSDSTPTTKESRLAAGVQIIDRSTEKVILSVEVSSPHQVMVIDGHRYEVSPEVLLWFRKEVIPIIDKINQGAPIRDL